MAVVVLVSKTPCDISPQMMRGESVRLYLVYFLVEDVFDVEAVKVDADEHQVL